MSSAIEYGVSSEKIPQLTYEEVVELKDLAFKEIHDARENLKNYCEEKCYDFTSLDLKIIAAYSQEIAEKFKFIDNLYKLFPCYFDFSNNMTLVNIDEYEELRNLKNPKNVSKN